MTKWVVGLAAVSLCALVSCNPVANDNASQVIMTASFDSLERTAFDFLFDDQLDGLISDVVDDTGSDASDDFFSVSVSSQQKNPLVNISSWYNVEFEAYQYFYTRADNRPSEPGVTVPFPRTFPLSGTLSVNGGRQFNLLLVTRDAKVESPLRDIWFTNQRIYAQITVTFFGRDRTGNGVQTSASTSIIFGDFETSTSVGGN